MPKFKVGWSKTYYASGAEIIEAETSEEATAIAIDNIGDYIGSMQYDPNEDVIDWPEEVSKWNEKQLTDNQIWCIEELKRQGYYFLASATELSWKAGKPYYIDDRVNVKGIYRKFNQGNEEAANAK